MTTEIGTLAVVVLKARNLRDIHSFYKQDVYAQISLNGKKHDTRVEVKGGQHPVWDDEIRVPVMKGESEKERKLQVSCWAKESRTDELLASGSVDISETLKTGEFDDWVPLVEPAGQQRGELYLEMTFYTNATPPPTPIPAPVPVPVIAPAPNQAKPVNKPNPYYLKVNGGNLQRRPSKLAPAERLARPPNSLLPNRPGPSNLSASRPPVDARKDTPLPSLPPASLSPNRLSPKSPAAVPSLLKPGPASRPPAERRASDPTQHPLFNGHHRKTSTSMSPPRTPNPYIDPPAHQSPPQISLPFTHDAPSFPIAMPAATPRPPETPYYPYNNTSNPQSPSQPVYQQQTFNQIPQPGFYQQPSYNVSPQPPPQHSYTPSPQPSPHPYTPTQQPPPHSYTPAPQPQPQSYTPAPQAQAYQQPYQAPYTPQPQPHQQYQSTLAQPYVPQLPVTSNLVHQPLSYSEQHRQSVSYTPAPQAAPPAATSNADGMPDPYLKARYQTPLPLPPSVKPPASLVTQPSNNDTERQEQERILREAERRKEQEEKDMELARMLDRELNLGEASSSPPGRREDRWRDSMVGPQTAMPGGWGR